MTSYGAYDEGLPCKNPNCKSHGRPHPNCQCYAALAHGGDVHHFCSEPRDHEARCEYFADGGQVPSHEDAEVSVASFLGDAGLHGLLKMHEKASENPDEDLSRYNRSVTRGSKKFHSKVDNLFDGNEASKKEDYTKAHDFIHKWMDSGGVTNDLHQEFYKQTETPHMAEGGDVHKTESTLHNHHIAKAYPEHNLMHQAAKGRMSNYLNSLKPQKNQPRLAFDDEPDTTQQEKSYKRAVKMAANPLHVLDKVNEGTIEPEHVKHFKNLHPEMDSVLQKKLAEKIIHAQLKKEQPKFHVKQGLSLLMGTPLSGELSPQNIQAAQATFANSKGGQPVTKNKKNTSTLTKVDDSFMTSDQARIARQQSQKR